MQLDKLELDLRPRSNAQALDLGFSLLRSHAAVTYLVWLSLWLPILGTCAALAIWDPDNFGWYLVLAWWLRALPERAPLYVLSRRVFGEHVGWWDALKAWPSQLGGIGRGAFSLLTWRRLFSPMRSLYAPIWQLEGARGKVAAERLLVIGRNGTYWASAWFGMALFWFEVVLALGLLAFIGIFMSDDQSINPFEIFFNFVSGQNKESWLIISMCFFVYAVAVGVIGPIYAACGFTLYLNRRATLEAWDIEIALRQLKAPQHQVMEGMTLTKSAAVLVSCLCGSLLAMTLALPTAPAQAQSLEGQTPPPANLSHCDAPKWIAARGKTQFPDIDEQQTKVRKQVADLYNSDDLRGYTCVKSMVLKNKKKDDDEEKKKPPRKDDGYPLDLSLLATVLKVMFIAAAIGLLLWLLYRFRDKLTGLVGRRLPPRATEIAGLDIRPESLPDDIPGQVMSMWRKGQKRLALALLYRATISRLVHDDGLMLAPGATEGDCTRLAERAFQAMKLSAGRLKATAGATELWLRAAYADRWPDEAAVLAGCVLWGAEFGPTPSKGAP